MAELDLVRATALVHRDPALLDRVYTATAVPRRSDELTIGRLRRGGWSVSGAAHLVQQVRLLEPAAGGGLARAQRMILQVVDRLPAYQILDGRGRVVDHTPARPAASEVMVLIRTAAGWRIDEVRDG